MQAITIFLLLKGERLSRMAQTPVRKRLLANGIEPLVVWISQLVSVYAGEPTNCLSGFNMPHTVLV